MPTPTVISSRQDKVDDLWDTLTTEQSSYKSSNRTYLQLALSSDPNPTDGVEVPTDRVTKMAGHDRDWSNAGLPETFPFSVECHEYVGSAVDGYKMKVRIKVGQDVWVYIRDSNGDVQDWIIEPGELPDV